MTRASALLALCTALAVATGCSGGVAISPAGTPKPRVGAGVAPGPGTQPASAGPGSPCGPDGKGCPPSTTSGPFGGAPRPVTDGVPVTLSGQVKLLSAGGVGLVANHGGQPDPPGEARVVSNNGGQIVANHGAGMLGKTKFYGLAAAPAAPPLDLLADARVEVYDAAGRPLVDAQGQPIGATTDAQGGYQLTARLPREGLVLRVRLAGQGEVPAGDLSALLPAVPAAGAVRTVPIDVASSLGASYVLQRLVRGDAAKLARLPADANDALSAGLEAARGLLPLSVPVYSAEALAQAAAELRRQDPPVDAALTRIEAILLGGQVALGNGLAATRVPLSAPSGIASDAAGNVFVGETVAGRVRRVAPDGTITLYAGAAVEGGLREKADARKALFGYVSDVVAEPSGALLVVEADLHQVRRIAPDGRVSVVAGDGRNARGTPGGPAEATSLARPVCVAVAPDGTIAIGENYVADSPARVLARDAAGTLHDLGLPAELAADAQVTGLAYAADGTLYVATGIAGRLLARSPAGAWRQLAQDLAMHDLSRIALAPDGGVFVSETRGHRVVKIAPDGTKTVVAGSGTLGYAGDGGPARDARLNRPAGLLLRPDGALWIVDSANMVVRACDPADPGKPITTVVGTTGAVEQGPATAIAINSPGGLALDAQGRVVVAEVGGSTIKRLEGGELKLLAGTTPGHADGPAAEAAFNAPGSMARDPDGSLWILETVHPTLRRLRPDGQVETRAGTGKQASAAIRYEQRRYAAADFDMGRPLYMVMGPDGRPYWADNAMHVICRLSAAGEVELVAGATPTSFDAAGDHADGPAAEARFNRPAGLAFDAAGDLYVADLGNMCVRKITGLGAGGTPAVSTVAGVIGLGALVAAEAQAQAQAPLPGAEAALVGPVSLAFDAEGRLYVGEIGTARLSTLAGAALLGALETVTPARVRRIDLADPRHLVTTVVGPGSRVLADREGEQALGLPLGLLFDAQGALVIADSLNNQLKLVPKAAL